MANERTRGGRSVREVMTTNPECVTEKDSIRNAAKMMVDCDCGALPVVEESSRKVIGMITDRDIVIRLVAHGKDTDDAKVGDAMSRGVHTVKESDSLDAVYRMMAKEQVRRVPVVGQNDEIIGIVAVADVATEDESDRRLAKTVEEISEQK